MSERTFYERVVERGDMKFIRLKSGRMITFLEAYYAAQRAETDLARAVSRAVKLAGTIVGDKESAGWDLERIEWFLDGLQAYINAVREEVEKRRGVQSKEERIALLRITTGRTPEEAAAFLRKADELEHQLKGST